MGYRVLILSAVDAAEVVATKRDQQGQSKLRLVDKYFAVIGNGSSSTVTLCCMDQSESTWVNTVIVQVAEPTSPLLYEGIAVAQVTKTAWCDVWITARKRERLDDF